MFALGTQLWSRGNVLPGGFSAKDIIHFLQLWSLPICHLARDVVHVGAGVAGEAAISRSAAGAEEQRGRHRPGAPGLFHSWLICLLAVVRVLSAWCQPEWSRTNERERMLGASRS